jgi:hypothetical protein
MFHVARRQSTVQWDRDQLLRQRRGNREAILRQPLVIRQPRAHRGIEVQRDAARALARYALRADRGDGFVEGAPPDHAPQPHHIARVTVADPATVWHRDQSLRPA